MTTNFKPGDTVRLTGKGWDDLDLGPSVGDIVTITRIDIDWGPAINHADGTEYYIYEGYEAELVAGDGDRPEHFKDIATLADQLNIPPASSEYSDPRYEAKIRENRDLQAVIRRRNEVISAQRDRLTEYAAQLEESTVGSALSQAADQLGLKAEDAAKALELGARLFASGITHDDIAFWRRIDRGYQRHFAARKDNA